MSNVSKSCVLAKIKSSTGAWWFILELGINIFSTQGPLTGFFTSFNNI